MVRGSGRLPLGARLVLASLGLQALMLALLVYSSLALMEQAMLDQAQRNNTSSEPLLASALVGPIAQYDYASAQEILDEVQAKGGYRYLALHDLDGKLIAAAGKVPAPLPAVDASLSGSLEDGTYDATLDISLGGQVYGVLRYGLRTDFLTQTQDRMLNVSGSIAIGALFSTWIILAFIGFWLTRRLTQLTQASQALAKGDFDISLPTEANDEVGQLARAFQGMAGQLRQRLSELKASEQRLHAISHYTHDLEMWIGPEGQLLWVNPSVLRMTGYTPEECLAMARFPLDLVLAEDRAEAEWRLREALQEESGTGQDYQFRLQRRDGSHFWASANWQTVRDTEGNRLGMRASVRDISELKAIEQSMLSSLRQLKISEASARSYLSDAEQEHARLMALLSAMSLGILFVGRDGRIVYRNPAFLRIWQLPEGSARLGTSALDVLKLAGSRPQRPEDLNAHLQRILAADADIDTVEIPMQHGQILTQQHHPVRDPAGQFIGYLWIYEDVTQQRQTAEQLLYLAERDSLTGLYNRHRFQDELNRAIAEAVRHQTTCALLFFDLDEFKAINDHFGHAAGDTLLIRVASEAASSVRRHESLFRMGGDEFAVIMPFASLADAQALAERIVRAIAQIPFQFEGRQLRISSSLGIALYPEHAGDGEQLVAFADSAMYQAKHSGKNAWRVYRADMDQTPEMLQRLSWNERLTKALDQDLFSLHFQGVYHVGSADLAHLEVLIRLRDPDTGELVMPGEFIPIAESTQKIVDIDRWVLRKAIGLLARHPAMPPLAVNLSGRSFDDLDMPGYIASQLLDQGVDPQRLLLEITETAAVSDLTDARRFIDSLTHLGCSVCLDDFGAGFASFAYLKHIAVDIIKIDGMFIRGLANDHDNQVFVRGMVEVAKGLGKRIVAECVEDEVTVRLLTGMGVDMVQGYHLDMPRAEHPAIK